MLLLERWTEPLAESNCYLLGEAGRAVVIDPNDPRGPLERLEALGWTPERILLTHEHCDHMAGLEALRNRWPGVRVAATAACSAGLGDTRLNMTRRMEVYLAFRGKPGVSYPPFVCRPADETYEHAWEYVWRGHRLRAVALPGHTPGSAGIFLDGDTFFALATGDGRGVNIPTLGALCASAADAVSEAIAQAIFNAEPGENQTSLKEILK